MHFQYSAPRILHEDHMASLALLSDVERLVLTRKAPPPAGDPEFARFAARLSGALAGEISEHFDFEEEILFPVLAQFGDGDLAELLTEEHHVLREVMREVSSRAKSSGSGFADAAWSDFRRLCGELVERLQSHVEKEERALLPVLENVLTPEVDAEVCTHRDI